MKNKIFLAFISLCLAGSVADAQVASGGSYTLNQAVIANGGETTSSGSTYVIGGTAGQAVAGTRSTGTPYNTYGGFWTNDAITTAAAFGVSGRVTGIGHRGIKGVTVTLIGGTNAPVQTTTNLKGNFHFPEIEAGQFYIVIVEKEGYVFAPAHHSFMLQEDVGNLNFQGFPLPPKAETEKKGF